MSTEQQQQQEKASDNPSPAPEARTAQSEEANGSTGGADYVTMPTLADEKQAAPNANVGIAHHDLASSTFEDDGTFALPPGETLKVTPIKPNSGASSSTSTAAQQQQEQQQQQQQSTTAKDTPGKGAQIFMNRFSNWRQKANENATILYQKAREAQEQAARENKGPLAALRQVAGSTAGVVGEGGGDVRGKGSSSYEDSEQEDDDHSSGSASHSSSQSESHSGEGDHEDEEEDNDDRNKQRRPDPQSTRSLPNLPSRQQVRSRVQNLAGGVINNLDSVATGFRGRYANTSEWNDTISKTPPPSVPMQNQNARESQTALILKSRAAEHLQDILNSLHPYEYVMLLGAGRLQVNLKNPYVKHQGTYVDFLVSGGAADKSGVVAVGDSIVKVGSQDVKKHTIADVPSIIAKAKRPVVLVLTTGTEMEVERITYLDLAVAMMHRIRDQDEKQKQAMIASAKTARKQNQEGESKSKEEHPEDEGTEAAQPLEEVGIPREEGPEDDDDEKFKNISIPFVRSVEDYANPPLPPIEARQAYKKLVGKR